MAEAKVTCVTEKASSEWERLSIGYKTPAGEIGMASLALDGIGKQITVEQADGSMGYVLEVIARRLQDLATFMGKHEEQPLPKLKEVA
ncbi:hypothetical protein [Pseudodesulfovibrio portus]|uniref:Uncharacterized protein n=1 Tax=Pseudodesulfovibrio portus TaxID=231439 RepID=A0ABN6RW40_9BACT|nr:hypothetical protein [Pseudodesulfovibrio portus]BDQ33591.1 hypothetical protein JCM14722_11330 [Pseudodesulfovibrio portus]